MGLLEWQLSTLVVFFFSQVEGRNKDAGNHDNNVDNKTQRNDVVKREKSRRQQRGNQRKRAKFNNKQTEKKKDNKNTKTKRPMKSYFCVRIKDLLGPPYVGSA